MRVGFTGTSKGTTVEQINKLLDFFESTKISEFHHGDCIGADFHAHLVAHTLGVSIIIHPPTNLIKRAFCEGTIREEKPYLKRNKDIVNETDLLIACPDGPEKLRSGTWSTIRYAYKQGKKVLIFMPTDNKS